MNSKILATAAMAASLSIAACHTTQKAAKPVAAATPKADTAKPVSPAPVAISPDKAQTLPSGLSYQFFKHGTATRKPVMNDKLEFNLTVKISDSVIFDSRKMNNNKPVPLQVAKPKFQGDPVEGYMLMSEGDSAVFHLPADTLLKSGSQMPPWMTAGKVLEYDVSMISIRNDSEVKHESERKMNRQKAVDDSLLQDYFAKNNLHPTKTASGLYYTVKQEGSGALPQAGNVMSIFYTGRFLGGNIFDSNQDSTFHHQDPLRVDLGKGRVIRGWDEGLAFLKKGGVATLYIPSFLGYGPKDRGPIPGNSILIFDVQVKDIQTAAEIDEKLLQDYFTEHKIKPLKTPGGVYYTIRKKGKGAMAKAGEAVTVKYSGKTLDGNVFDSNTDSAYHHVTDLKFELGKGRVIKGWDDGFTVLNKGAEATLYIPSEMAYGSQGQGRKIPPNAVLIFDVAVVDIGKPDPAPSSFDSKGQTR
jgi:FKBP-type peptidyl-prolyl cis-trans isomerase FkpA